VAHRPEILFVEHPLGSQWGAEQSHQPVDQLGLEPGQLRGLLLGVVASGTWKMSSA